MPRTLLLADDSITIQKVVAITFAAEDFKVVAVDNGEDALAKAREIMPAVILADVVMPKRNGYELAQAIKSDPELGSIPVLLLAGTFEPFDPAKATASRADGHIVKPFDSQALIDKVNELVGGAVAAPPPAAARPTAPAPWSTTPPAASPSRAPSTPGMPQRPQPISTALPRPGSVPPPASPSAAPSVARPVFTPAPLPLTVPAAPAPLPLRPAATAAPLPLRPAPLQLTQPPSPASAAPFALTQPVNPMPRTSAASSAPVSPSPLPLTSPISTAAAPLPLGSPSSWGGAATPRPPVPASSPPSRIPIAPTPLSQAPKPIALTPAWGIPVESAAPPPPAVSPPSGRRDPFGLGTPAPQPAKPAPAASLMAEAAAAASVQPSSADIPLDVPIEYEQQDSPEGFELGGSQELDVSMTGGATFTSGSLSDFSQQETPPAAGAIELTEELEDETLELASPHEFLGGTPAASPRPPSPAPAIAKPLQLKPAVPVATPSAISASPAATATNGDGEAALRLALSQASKEVIERIVWEVVPQLAETIVREHVERLAQERSGK